MHKICIWVESLGLPCDQDLLGPSRPVPIGSQLPGLPAARAAGYKMGPARWGRRGGGERLGEVIWPWEVGCGTALNRQLL